jgi:hypothetical protein
MDNPEDIKNLEAEYTAALFVEDVSPSTNNLRPEMCNGRKTIVGACKISPRASNIMMRTTSFGSQVEENHGFKPIDGIDESQFVESPSIGGSTCLYDAIFDAVSAAGRWAEIMDKSDVGTNAIIFVFTDGMDNSSTVGPQTILDKLEEIRMKEILESVKIIVIGFNDPNSGYSSEVAKYLQDVVDKLGLDQYVDVGNMTKEQAAKLFGFVIASVSAQSQSLGTGGASQNLTF